MVYTYYMYVYVYTYMYVYTYTYMYMYMYTYMYMYMYIYMITYWCGCTHTQFELVICNNGGMENMVGKYHLFQILRNILSSCGHKYNEQRKHARTKD